MPFEKIIGNERVKETLVKLYKKDNISHSYIFLGIEGLGKKLIAKEFAKMILCSEKQGLPCGKCKSCVQFETGNHSDYINIEPDGVSIKIEQIRNMQMKVCERPIVSNRKIYIIDDADKMTVESQNCLLKTLEEPPEYIIIILIVSNENTLLNTIKSRCSKIKFNKLMDKQIKDFLMNQYGISIVTSNSLKYFDGSIGKAVKIKDKLDDYSNLEDKILNINKKNQLEFLNIKDFFTENRENINEILDYMIVIFFNMNNINFLKVINTIQETKDNLKVNLNFDMAIDNLLFKICDYMEFK